ncbi:hypothetical protein PR202_ga23337 [Eleusine coracana subsp. coracana]|uniref:G-patch domain-containing protein n=1 Tax=Eleusine coracana subsp. coracana TaxID=191504 RepID=A0AAV5D3Z6_ELECO|nr:hypothetical protein PR202_ga23337 [Eleusine coracana subsp. coracana]
MDGSGGDAEAEGGSGGGGGFEWDADSQLYYHASTGFYHDPVAGWYYSSKDGQYYIYENGNYVPLTTNLGNEPEAHHPCDEANQDVAEPAIPEDENETLGPPSEWMEETLINLYLSGYTNREANVERSLGNTCTNEEDRNETAGKFTADNASSLNDATLLQNEDEMETKDSTFVHESLGKEEEKWLSQYGQVERINDDLPLLPTIDLWDWDMVHDPVSVNKGQPLARLVGCLSRNSSKLHPSLPSRGGLLRTAPVCEVHLDIVRVQQVRLFRFDMQDMLFILLKISVNKRFAMKHHHYSLVLLPGKLYRLRNPSRKYLTSLSTYDSSNPTKDWGFPDLYANPDIDLHKQPIAQCQSEVADESFTVRGISTASGKEHKTKAYRDRAAERRNLHGGLGIGPGQKRSNIFDVDESEESDENMDQMGLVDVNFRSSGLHSAKRIMENMGWKEGEALGKSRKGIVEPIQPIINKHGAGLGWNQTR